VALSVVRAAERVPVGGELKWTISPADGRAPYAIEAAVDKKQPDGTWANVAERDFDTAGEPVTLTIAAAEAGEYRCLAMVWDDDDIFNTPADASETVVAAVPPVASIAPASASVALGLGESYALAVSALPEGSVPELSYDSNNKGVATVDALGTVAAKKTGTATIAIRDAGGASATVSVTVKKAPTSVSLVASRSTLGVGEVMPLGAALSSGSAGRCTFFSSDPTVAAIDANAVTALKPGIAYLTVTTYNGKTTAKKPFKLTVLPAPESVSLDPTEWTLGVGDSKALKAAITPGSAGAYAFSSDNEAVAKVDPKTGKVTAVSVGAAVVTVKTFNEKAASCAVTVAPAPTKLSLSAPGGRGTIGLYEKMRLTPAIDPGSEATFTYWSSNTRYVTVGADGTVYGRRVGSATVYAMAHNKVKASLKITVKKAPRSVSLRADRLTLGVGEVMALGAALPSGTAGGCWFESSNPGSAVIEGSAVRAVAPGKSTIAVWTYNWKKKTATLTVLPAPEGVSLDRAELALGVGDGATLKAALTPGSAGACEFTSDKPEIAKVDLKTGRVTAVSVGTALVTVRTFNGHESSCAVTVFPAPTAVRLSLSNGRGSVGVGERVQLATALDPADAKATIVYWSSNTKYVTVGADGVVTGKRAGSATVYAKAHNKKQTALKIWVGNAPSSVSLTLERNVLGEREEAAWIAKLPSGSAGRVDVRSDNEAVARVEGNRVIAVAPGTANIIATTYNGKNNVKTPAVLTVRPEPTGVAVSPSAAVICKGDTLKLSAAVNEGSAGAIRFSSGDPGIASVGEATGVVIGVSPGDATISATAYNGVPGTMALRVLPALEALALKTPAADASGGYALVLRKGDRFQIAPEMGELTHLGITYASSNTSVASVDASGLLSAKKSGSATITVKPYAGKPATIRLTVQKWTDQVGSLDIAHAMGGVGGLDYSNSLEAFEYNYARGYRVFEVDLSWTSDGEIVLWHDWSVNQFLKDKPKGYVPSLAEFESAKIYGQYTPLTYQGLLALMEAHPDVTVVLDTKVRTADQATKLYTKMKDTADTPEKLDTFDRMVAYVYSKDTFYAIDGVHHFKNYVFGYYLLNKKPPSTSGFASLAKFCHENGIDMIAMNYKWWSTKYKSAAKTYDVAVAAHTVNSVSTAKKLLSAGISSIVTDHLTPRIK